ncbi:unnamed protein product [Paramecium pentaurelia]|uniref:Uncharacterized protein n=1 Tax=Paramecium pentaurelia TaxID=43138 RepID=A0A8S1XTP6_9CILI|nr:unnamed protein product [Paramecium pentaurelia]
MRTNQGSSSDFFNRQNQTKRDNIDPFGPNSPNAQKEQTGYVTREKYNKLKDLNSKLKAALRDYMQEGKDQEKILQLKEEIIQKYEREQLNWQNKGNEDLKSQLNQLKIKIQKKKTKIRLLKDQSKVFDVKMDEQKGQFQMELDRVQRLYDALITEIKDQEKRYKQLKDENNVIKQAIISKDEQFRYLEIEIKEDKQTIQILESKIKEHFEENKILQLTIDNLIIKNEDLEKLIKINETHHQQDINKLQSDKLTYQQELNTQINKKKEKIKNMSNQIQQLDNLVNQKQQQEFTFNNLVQEKQKEYIILQGQLDDQKNKTDQAIKEANCYIQDIKQLKSELEQLKSLIKIHEDKLTQYDQQYQLDQEEKAQILQDLEQLNQDNKRLQQLLYESDNDISYLNQQHLEKQQQMEQQIEYLQNQLNLQKDHLTESKIFIQEMQKQQVANEEQIEIYKNKYLKSKQNQKTLQNEQRYLEDKMKMIENERIQDEREAIKTKDYIIQQKQVQQSKIKVLDDIQNMIKQHKRTNN